MFTPRGGQPHKWQLQSLTGRLGYLVLSRAYEQGQGKLLWPDQPLAGGGGFKASPFPDYFKRNSRVSCAGSYAAQLGLVPQSLGHPSLKKHDEQAIYRKPGHLLSFSSRTELEDMKKGPPLDKSSCYYSGSRSL